MARFRAFSSDTSSSEDEGEEVPVENSVPPEKEPSHAPSNVENDLQSDSEESSSGSSSSSAMEEDELVSSPPRKRKSSKPQDQNALVQDEDGDARHRVSPPSSPESPLAKLRPIPRGDPSIIPWAQHVGVDPQKVHVMQTSLFRVPEEAAALKALNDTTKPQSSHKRLDLNPSAQNLNRKHSRDSDGGAEGLRVDSRERKSFAHHIDPPTFRPSRKYARVGITSSVANGSEGAYVDAGLAMGRSFRVGWGPAGYLVHLGSICSPMSTTHTPANSSTITITITKTLPFLVSSWSEPNGAFSSPTSPTLAAKLLQHHLSHTSISPDESGIPFASPTSPTNPATTTRSRTHAPASSADPLNFSSFASLFPSDENASPAPVFRLGSALFDPLELYLGRSKRNTILNGTSITPDLRNRVALLRRKTALGKWLKDVVKPSVDADLRLQTNNLNVSYTAADAAFTQLTGNQISEACKTAADGGYIKLSILLSQAGGDPDFKQDILEQIEIWKSEKLSPGSTLSNGQNGLVSRGVWRLYNLLGGLLHQEDSAGKGDNVCAGLDWKRVFGLFLWYGTNVDASVGDVVDAYENALLQSSRGTSKDIARPIPKWAANQAKKGLPLLMRPARPGLFAGSSSTAKDSTPEDPLYALIKIHANPALSLSNALNPLSFAPSGLDWGIGMCWHLYIILSRVMRVRDFSDRSHFGTRIRGRKGKGGGLVNGRSSRKGVDGNMDEWSRDESDDELQADGHSPSADLLTSSYAFELESWGMIQEAAFVLMHLEGSVGREKAIKDLLARSGGNLDDWTTRGLVGSLKLPMTWVDEAKAIYEYDSGHFYAAYELYLSAACYNAAHSLALLELAPDAIIRKDWELLGRLFAPFNSTGRRDKIERWFVRGQVFLDFVETVTKLPQLLDEVAAENDEQPAIPDAARTEEIERLAKRAPRIIALLPDILHRSRSVDSRHVAALEEMSKDLLKLIERAQPLLLSNIQQPTLNVLDSATKINLVRGIGYARFLQSIEA